MIDKMTTAMQVAAFDAETIDLALLVGVQGATERKTGLRAGGL
jgi:hypothetical protein